MTVADDRLWHEPAGPACPLNGRYRVISETTYAQCEFFAFLTPLRRWMQRCGRNRYCSLRTARYTSPGLPFTSLSSSIVTRRLRPVNRNGRS